MLPDYEAASSPSLHWSWKRISLWLFGISGALAIAILAYDQKLEPYDDLLPRAHESGDAKTNGYLYLKAKWQNQPELPRDLRDTINKMIYGSGPWDQAVLDKLRPGRETVRSDLTAALALPTYSPPAILSPIDDMDVGQSWLMPPVRYLFLEAAAARHSGDISAALSILKDLRALSRRHFEADAGLITLLVGISLESMGDSSACGLLAEDRLGAGELADLSGNWRPEADIASAWQEAMKAEAAFFRNSVELVKNSDLRLPEGSRTTTPRLIFLKKNLTINKSHRKMRYFSVNSLKLALTAEGTDILRDLLSPPPKPKWIRNLNPNYTGEKLLDFGDSLIGILPGIITKTMFNPRAMRVNIALHQWRLAHPGSWPANLHELVPDYLPSIPLDPWSGKPLLWDASLKVIYSVGSDWKPDLPSFSATQRNWFAEDYESPGLRLELPSLPPPPAVKVKKAPQTTGPAPAPETPSSNAAPSR